MSSDMRRDFQDREDLIAYLREQFPEAVAIDDHVTTTRGGLQSARVRLAMIRPGRQYRDTRNHLDGAVTRLSPYIRHGVLSLTEVRAAALQADENPAELEKFFSELGWRDYFQRVYRELGDRIWEDIEPYKTGFEAHEYADELPVDLRSATTGVRMIDDFARELFETGYLHNHARMWLAAYVVHWRRIKWQAGARWFLEHLLDGDPASNNLSWQWVASTFSAKPYYFNMEAVHQFSGDRYPRRPGDGHEIFEGTYEEIAARLFPRIGSMSQHTKGPRTNSGRKRHR